MANNPIRVLVVEDSPLMSEMITHALESDPQIKVVGVANEGSRAIEMVAELHPDLVTMDIYMPNVDGFTAVEQIMAYYPTPILVITATSARSDVNVSMKMLAAGALDVVEKPTRQDEESWAKKQADLVQRARLLAGVRVVTHLRGRHKPLISASPATAAGVPGIDPALRPGGSKTRRGTGTLPHRVNTGVLKPPPFTPLPAVPITHAPFPLKPLYRVVAIASSTGGPQALLSVLRNIPPDFPASLLIVQHIASGFTAGLAEWLDRECKLPVRVARDGQQATVGTAYLAPDDKHLICTRNGGNYILSTFEGGNETMRPAADVLFRAVAESCGPHAVGVILTGMGRDGAEGLKQMHEAGAYTVAQDEATSVIFGMPAAAIKLGAAQEVLPLDAISSRLVNLLTIPDKQG